MKKTIAIIAIIFCVLATSTVFATSAQQQTIDSLSGTTQQAIDNLTGGSKENNNVESESEVVALDEEKENSKDTSNVSNTESTTTIKSEETKKTDSTESNSATSKIVDMKDKEKKTLEDYQQAYGSDAYGLTAYVLSRIQIYSIPFCFLGIAISAIYQYVLGIRKLDTRDKGFAIMISIITIFVIAQVLPLIFAIVVKGWRG